MRCACARRQRGQAFFGWRSRQEENFTNVLPPFRICEQMEKQGITAIINLCEAGEHPYCGDGLDPTSGLPYSPDKFHAHGIAVYYMGA